MVGPVRVTHPGLSTSSVWSYQPLRAPRTPGATTFSSGAPNFGEVQPGGTDTDTDLTRAGLGIGRLPHLQHLRPAVPGYPDRSHIALRGRSGHGVGHRPRRASHSPRRLVDRQQLGREGIQVELVAQPDAVGLDGLGRVVLAPVEAPITRLLVATPGGST